MTTNQMQVLRQQLLEIFNAAVHVVSGRICVANEFVSGKYPEVFHVVAIGKAADAMVQGIPTKRIKSGLLITKRGHTSDILISDKRFSCIESDHPLPTNASLDAGQALLDYLAQLPGKDPCLFLISGGASALVEVLQDGWDLAQLQALTDFLLANAYSIDEINAIRRSISQIKGGGLWKFVGKRPVFCLLISDVPDDDPAIIGSGLLFPQQNKRTSQAYKLPDLPAEWKNKISIMRNKINTTPDNFHWKIIASLTDAKNAAARKAIELGYEARIMPEFLGGDAVKSAKYCVDSILSDPDTLFVWGGETTVNLPDNPGKGGRNQHLALAATIQLDSQENAVLLSAGTDGSDGLTDVTGAIVDGLTLKRGASQKMIAEDFLKRADSHTFLRKVDNLVKTGATGTNVMDLVMAIKMRE